MSASKLVRPCVDAKESYISAMKEYHAEKRFLDREIPYLNNQFSVFVENMNEDRGQPNERFPDWVERVPETVLWLMKDNTYYGSLYIRHRLNWHLEKWGGHVSFVIRPTKRGQGFGKKILQKGIPAINAVGIDKALITIDPNDTAGIRIAECCDAEYYDTTPETDRFPSRMRYWLNCS